MKINFKIAEISDVNALIEVQNKAFYSDYIKYGYCPGYGHTYEKMITIIKNHYTFKILADGKIIGDIIVKEREKYSFFLGGICVIPAMENKGIGQKAMQFIINYFSTARHWSLETPADKLRNHYFYKKCGFQITKEYLVGNVGIVLFERSVTL